MTYLIAKTEALIYAEKVMVEVMRITKLANPIAVKDITRDDFDYISKNLVRDYLSDDYEKGKKVLDAGVAQYFLQSQSNVNINVGHFSAACYGIKKQGEEVLRTQKMINKPTNAVGKALARENFTKMNDILREAVKATKPKATKHTFAEVKKNPELTKQALERLDNKAGLVLEDLLSYGMLKERAPLFINKFGLPLCQKYMIEYTTYVGVEMKKDRTALVYTIDEFFCRKQER